MKKIAYHPAARHELNDAVAHYDREQDGLGKRFLSELKDAVKRIRNNPELGSPHNSSDVRFFLVHHFPFVIYYQNKSDSILIVAVAHGKRRKDYWINRVRQE